MANQLKRFYYSLIILSGSLPLTGLALETPQNLPASIDPSRVSQQIAAPLKPPAPVSRGITESKTPEPTLSKGAEKITFLLKQLVITGNTVFSYQQLLPLFQQYLGKKISLADIERVNQAITLKYRNAGYIVSRAIIPAQTIDKGLVHIQIIEGYVAETAISNNAQGAHSLLEKYGHKLSQKRPLTIQTLERYALLANAIPGMNSVKTVLQPPADKTAPLGATDVSFTPDFSKAAAFISFDNRGTKYLGPNEFSAGGSLNSLVQSGDQFGAQGLASSDWHELHYANVYTNQPIGATGGTVNLSGSISRTEPGYLLAPLQVQGESEEIVADADMPWFRTRKQSFYTVLGFDWLNNKTDINLFNANFYNDHVRSLRFGVKYYRQDKWAGANQAGLQVSHGLGILGASDKNDTDLSRIGADPRYTKLNGTLSRLQGITDQIACYIGVIGQYAYEPLLSSEQFAFGGTQYGQAYDPSEITGDNGLAAKTELRYNAAPGFRYLSHVQYFAFYDVGKVWNINSERVTGLPKAQSAASTGIGARFNFNQHLFGTAEIAQPLTRRVSTNQSFAPRFFISLMVTGKTHAPAPFQSPDRFNTETSPAGFTDAKATNGPDAAMAAR